MPPVRFVPHGPATNRHGPPPNRLPRLPQLSTTPAGRFEHDVPALSISIGARPGASTLSRLRRSPRSGSIPWRLRRFHANRILPPAAPRLIGGAAEYKVGSARVGNQSQRSHAPSTASARCLSHLLTDASRRAPLPPSEALPARLTGQSDPQAQAQTQPQPCHARRAAGIACVLVNAGVAGRLSPDRPPPV